MYICYRVHLLPSFWLHLLRMMWTKYIFIAENCKSRVYDFGNSYMGITSELSCRSRLPTVSFVWCITLSFVSDAFFHASSWSRTDYRLAHACIRSGKQTDIPRVVAVFVSWCTLNYMTLLQQFYITQIWFCFLKQCAKTWLLWGKTFQLLRNEPSENFKNWFTYLLHGEESFLKRSLVLG
jgi:hypothetical protein